MSEKLDQAFNKKGYPNGQWAYEKVLNVINHQENTN